MSNGKGPAGKSATTWTNAQAYALAVIALLAGLAAGYLLRGSAGAPTGQVSPAESQAPASAPANTGAAPQPSPEQAKQAADAQAAPLLLQLKGDPANAQLLASIGNIYYDARDFGDAVSYYGRSLQINPKDPNVRTDMGTAYYYLGDPDRAIKEFHTALQDDPKHGQTLFNLGMVQWEGKGDSKAAVASWEKLLQVAPDYPERSRVEELISRAKQHTAIKPGTTTEKPATM